MLRYHGGKWALAPWVIGYFPPHQVYTEAFGGAASVLMRKDRVPTEIYNDLDGEVVNVFRVMQNPETAAELERKLRYTPYAFEEFNLAYEKCDEPVEQARRTIIRSFMGYSSDAVTRKWRTGFRMKHLQHKSSTASEWANYPDHLEAFTARLRGVVIQNCDAWEVIQKNDSPNTLHYVDPPYLHETRCHHQSHKTVENYNHEMSRDDHIQLAKVLRAARGMVVISGYYTELYNELYAGWTKEAKESIISAGRGGGARRTEVLWISPRTVSQANMFDGTGE